MKKRVAAAQEKKSKGGKSVSSLAQTKDLAIE